MATMFCVDYANRPLKCYICKKLIAEDDLIMAVIGDQKVGFECHPNCLLTACEERRVKVTADQIKGIEGIEDEDQEFLLLRVKALVYDLPPSEETPLKRSQLYSSRLFSKSKKVAWDFVYIEDNRLAKFGNLCEQLRAESHLIEKQEVLIGFLKEGSDNGDSFGGDLVVFLNLLVPRLTRRRFDLRDEDLIAFFSAILGAKEIDMRCDLIKFNGDISQVIEHHFSISDTLWPLQESRLSILEVDAFLEQFLSSKDSGERRLLLKRISSMSTRSDLKTIIKCLKGDPETGMSERMVLESLDSNGEQAFREAGDLQGFVMRIMASGICTASPEG